MKLWVFVGIGLLWAAVGGVVLYFNKQITEPLGWKIEWVVIGWMGVSLVLSQVAKFVLSRERRKDS